MEIKTNPGGQVWLLTVTEVLPEENLVGRCGEQVKAGEKGANRDGGGRGTTRPGHQVVRTAGCPHPHQNLALRTQA